VHLVSYSSVQRLEKLDECPTDPRRRLVAFLTLLLYGFDPQDFGLSTGDLPRALDPKKIASIIRAAGVLLSSAAA